MLLIAEFSICVDKYRYNTCTRCESSVKEHIELHVLGDCSDLRIALVPITSAIGHLNNWFFVNIKKQNRPSGY